MKTVVVGAPCGANPPIFGSDCSRRSRPSPSRYTAAVVRFTMWLPSAKVCVFSVTALPEYGAPFTGLPPTSSPETKEKVLATAPGIPGGTPVVKITSRCCASSDAPETNNRAAHFTVVIILSPFLWNIESHKPDGPRHPLFAHQNVGLDGIGQMIFAHRQSHRAHRRRRKLHPQHLPALKR